ncbi:MAG: class D sortase [Candidatus Dormibacteraceae bacterium]
MKERRGRRVRRVGFGLIGAGLLLIVGTGASFLYGQWKGAQIDRQWHQIVLAAPPPAVPVDPTAALRHPVDGVDFAIDIPRIGYDHAVQEGVGAMVLLAGPGHYAGTAWPGQMGNVGVAAHNTYWIHVDSLKVGDEIDLLTRWGNFKYHVTAFQIVKPSDVAVLAQKPGQHRLTLTTCWPLWAGAFATQRFIISAVQYFPAVAPPHFHK